MRNTKQRDCIFDIVNSSYNHLNAYQIYDIAKKVIYNISLGTVYRNLAWLSEHNKVRTIVVVVHDHFICNECKNIIDIPRNDNSNNYIDGNLVIDYDVKYVGICKKCLERKEKNGIKRKQD